MLLSCAPCYIESTLAARPSLRAHPHCSPATNERAVPAKAFPKEVEEVLEGVTRVLSGEAVCQEDDSDSDAAQELDEDEASPFWCLAFFPTIGGSFQTVSVAEPVTTVSTDSASAGQSRRGAPL